MKEDNNILLKEVKVPTQKLYCSHSQCNVAQKIILKNTLEEQVEHFQFLRTVDDEPFTLPWLLRVKDRIRQSAIVICLISESTFMDNAVLWELTVAYALKKRVLGVMLHPEHLCIVPDVIVEQKSRVMSFNEALTRYESDN